MKFAGLRISFIFFVLLLVYSCKKSDDIIQREISHISFINLLPDSTLKNRPDVRLGVDFYIGEQLVNINPFFYRQGTSRYIDLISNKTQIYIRRGSETLITDTLALADKQFYSVFLGHTARRAGLRDTIFSIATSDDLTQTSSGQNAKVRFAFMSPDMPDVNVTAKIRRSNRDSVILTNQMFRTVTDFLELRGDSVIFKFESAAKELRVTDTVFIQPGKIYTYSTYGTWLGSPGQDPTFGLVETVYK